jgi:hypothetical protein
MLIFLYKMPGCIQYQIMMRSFREALQEHHNSLQGRDFMTYGVKSKNSAFAVF